MEAAAKIPPRIRRPLPWWIWPGALLLTLAGGVVLFVVDPAKQAIFPPCQFYRLTGWSCPGCGGTRAVHQLLHGELGAAFRLNALFVLALPVLAYWLARLVVWQMTGREWPFFRWHRAWGWGLGILLVFFFLARNLPVPGLSWMKL
jgi:hypothetical protein